MLELASCDPDGDEDYENDDSIDSIIGDEEDEDQYDDDNKEDENDYQDDNEGENVDDDGDTGSIMETNKENNRSTGEVPDTQDDLFNVDINDMKGKRKKSKKTMQKRLKKVSEVTGRAKWHQTQKTMEEAQMDFFKTVGEQIKSDSTQEKAPPVAETENELFGRYIAAQIAKLPEKYQRIAQHEIGNTIFNVQTRSDNENQHQITGSSGSQTIQRLRSPLTDVAAPNAGAVRHPQQPQLINYSINDIDTPENRPYFRPRWSQDERSEAQTVGDIGSAIASSLNTYSDIASPEYNMGT